MESPSGDTRVSRDTPLSLLKPDSLIVNTLASQNVNTIGDLLETSADAFKSISGVGARKVQLIDAFRERARACLEGDPEEIKTIREHYDVVPSVLLPAPSGPGELVERMLAALDERSCHVIRQRYWEVRTLQDVADRFEVSRERIRQIESAAITVLRKQMQADAERFAQTLAVELTATGGLIPLDALPVLDFEGPAEARLICDVAGEPEIRVLHGRFLSTLRREDWVGVIRELRDALSQREETKLKLTEVAKVTAQVLGVSLEQSDLRWLIEEELGLNIVGDEVMRSLSRKEWLLIVLKDAGEPMSTPALVERFAGRQGLDLEDMTPREVELMTKNVTTFRSDCSQAVPLEQGLYVHEVHLPWPQSAIQRFVRAAVEDLRGREHAVSAKWLLEQHTNDDLNGMTWATAKHYLGLQPGVQPLGASHQVAWAETFNESTHSVEHHVEQVLKDNPTVMTSDEVLEHLRYVDFHPVGVGNTMKKGDFAVYLGNGRYVHQKYTGLESADEAALLDTTHEVLGDDVAFPAELLSRVLERRPDLAIEPSVEDLDPADVLSYLLWDDPRFLTTRSRLVARKGHPAEGELFTHFVMGGLERVGHDATARAVHEYLRDHRYYDGSYGSVATSLREIRGKRR